MTIPGGRRLAALVARDAEADAILASFRSEASGRLGAVLVTGEPGLGKTRLAGEAADRLEADESVAVLRGYALDLGEGAPPFLPLRNSFQAAWEAAPPTPGGPGAGRPWGRSGRSPRPASGVWPASRPRPNGSVCSARWPSSSCGSPGSGPGPSAGRPSPTYAALEELTRLRRLTVLPLRRLASDHVVRLERLPPRTRRVLAAASVLGRDFNTRDVGAMLGATGAEVEAALVPARLASVIARIAEETWSFRHDAFRLRTGQPSTAPPPSSWSRRTPTPDR